MSTSYLNLWFAIADDLPADMQLTISQLKEKGSLSPLDFLFSLPFSVSPLPLYPRLLRTCPTCSPIRVSSFEAQTHIEKLREILSEFTEDLSKEERMEKLNK